MVLFITNAVYIYTAPHQDRPDIFVAIGVPGNKELNNKKNYQQDKEFNELTLKDIYRNLKHSLTGNSNDNLDCNLQKKQITSTNEKLFNRQVTPLFEYNKIMIFISGQLLSSHHKPPK